jgi:hypothetical protein
MLAVVGKGRLSSSDLEGHRRLDNPDDFVRLEIAKALKRDIRVIPVLVDGVSMPQPRGLPEDLKTLFSAMRFCSVTTASARAWSGSKLQ